MRQIRQMQHPIAKVRFNSTYFIMRLAQQIFQQLAEIRAIVTKPEVKAFWEKQGAEPIPMAPVEFEAFLRAELDKWTKVVKAANIKLE